MRRAFALVAWTSFALSALSALSACAGDAARRAPAPPPSTSTSTSTSTTTATATASSPLAADLRRTVHDAVDALLASNPVRATRLGDHAFDDAWPDVTAAGEARIAADLRGRARTLRELASRVPPSVPPREIAAWETDTPALDARVLASRLDGAAYELADVRPLERHASHATSLIGSGVTSLTSQAFAPKRARMERLTTRLGAVPQLLADARARLVHPSRASLDVLPIVTTGLTRTLRGDVAKTDPAALDGDAALAARLAESANKAADALDAYAADVARTFPRDKTRDEPLGAAKWQALARFDEGVEETPAAVRKMGEDELRRLLAELDVLIAKSGRPGETRAAFVHRIEHEAELPETAVLDEYRASVRRVNAWLRVHPFATVPWEQLDLSVVPSPPERRGVAFASINAAGPLEPVQRGEAKLEVTAPEATMPPPLRAALAAFHVRGAIDLVTIHEAVPGHDLQILAQQRTPSLVRKVVWAATLGEGWAHYCEQAVIDGGYTGDDAVRTRAFYLRMALQRAVRVILDVGENDGSLDVESGARLLEDNAFLAHDAALMEARRAVVAPANMFAYTYGKLAILRLRRERADLGAVRFHDQLLALGAIPVGEVTRILRGSPR